jgi:site-specific recombinase XerC
VKNRATSIGSSDANQHYTALRLRELAALNVEDVVISARKGIVVVRSGNGDAYREVPWNGRAGPARGEQWNEKSR